MRLEIASHIIISAKLFAGLSVIVSSPPPTILRCETISLGCCSYERRGGGSPTRPITNCTVGLEGIVSKRLGSRYRSGRSSDWLKFKNPAAPAVRREAEEDWTRGK